MKIQKLKKPSHIIQQPTITLVDQILTAKNPPQSPLTKGKLRGVVPFSKGELPNADTSALENQIDEMVYALYGLTSEEIAIVEGSKKQIVK